MKYGYIRVSTKEQKEIRQIQELCNYVDIKNIFIDKKSGKDFDREQYKSLKLILTPEDELFIKELDRLGRNKKEILQELQYFKERKVIVRILDIPTTLMDFKSFGEMQRLIMEMINNILIEVLSMQSEAELKKIKQRQKEGIQIAKNNGKYKNCGRPKNNIAEDDNFVFLYGQYKNKKIKAVNFAKMMNCSRTTLYKNIKIYETQEKNSHQK